MSAPLWEDRPTYCRIRSIKRDTFGRRGPTLQGWRTRNRLFMLTSTNVLIHVPTSYGTSTMISLMERGRLFLLTNGIY